jgi:hypothetical protein
VRLAVHEVERAREAHDEPAKQAICSPTASVSDVQEVPGRLSNPALTTGKPPSLHQVQRRLTPGDVDKICTTYINGKTITELARFFEVHPAAIMNHL